MTKLPMTAAGHSALEGELKHRIAVERPRLIQRVQEAIADDTNLVENSDYQIAKAEQQTNEARIVELEDKLARAEVIDISKLSGDTIKFGATVTLIDEDTDEKKGWQSGGEPEADATIPEAEDSPSYRFGRGALRDHPMSALGQKQKAMSASPPKADMCDAARDVRFGPI